MLSYWLPLNGNINNNGLSSLSPIPSATPTYNDNGKIGKCFASGSQYISLPLENVPTALSICFWVKPNSPGAWSDIFSLGVNDNRMEVSTTTQYYWYCNSSSTALIGSSNALFTLDNAVWNHICMTADGTTVKFYLNGSLVKTFSQISSFSDVFGGNLKINIGSRIDGSIMYSGYINDFRVYTDEVISLKQLQHIKSALVCHYPLKSQYETGQVNKYSGDVAEGSLSTSDFTKTKLEDERGYNYKITYTGTGSNRWDYMRAELFSFTVGKKYYYSCKVRCRSKNFNLYLRASRSVDDFVTNMTNVLTPDGEWHEYYVYQTINETYDRSGSTVTCNPILEFYTDNLSTSGKVYSADFDIKDIQVIESDSYVPFIDNSMASTVVSDCSGYGNDGTANGVITWSDNSPRYHGSYYFPTNAYIDCGKGGKVTDEITVNIWCYMDTWNDNGHLVCCTENGGWDMYISNSHPIFIVYIPDVGYGVAQSSKLWSDLSSGWHMFTGTYDGFNIKLYIDGILESSVSSGKSSKTSIYYNSTNSIYIHAESSVPTPITGYDACKLSDCRIYATALSESDIKSLYNVSASIDKTGVLSCYEFCEEE